MSSFRPMLAATVEDLNKLDMSSPLLVSPKIDGVRGIFKDGALLSRSLKPLPNKNLQRYVEYLYNKTRGAVEGIDCEVVIGSPTAKDCYRKTNSSVMSHNGELAGLSFLAFDRVCDAPYWDRLNTIEPVSGVDRVFVHCLPQSKVTTQGEIINLHNRYAAEGYEGLILRCPSAPYKFGRSTLKERYLLKYKHFSDDEGTVVGFEELMTNNNPQEKNELGYAKRSSKQENLAGAATLGALVVSYNGLVFRIGTGFTQADRDTIWQNRDRYLGKTVKFKYFAIGVKDAPRHPVWLGFRDSRDL